MNRVDPQVFGLSRDGSAGVEAVDPLVVAALEAAFLRHTVPAPAPLCAAHPTAASLMRSGRTAIIGEILPPPIPLGYDGRHGYTGFLPPPLPEEATECEAAGSVATAAEPGDGRFGVSGKLPWFIRGLSQALSVSTLLAAAVGIAAIGSPAGTEPVAYAALVAPNERPAPFSSSGAAASRASSEMPPREVAAAPRLAREGQLPTAVAALPIAPGEVVRAEVSPSMVSPPIDWPPIDWPEGTVVIAALGEPVWPPLVAPRQVPVVEAETGAAPAADKVKPAGAKKSRASPRSETSKSAVAREVRRVAALQTPEHAPAVRSPRQAVRTIYRRETAGPSTRAAAPTKAPDTLETWFGQIFETGQ